MPVAVKICGLSTPQSVDVAVEGGAQFVGFVFFPPSPRAIDPAKARALAGRVPASVRKVAVVVDPTDDSLETIVGALDADMIQLHGKETPERVADIRANVGCDVIKAIAVFDAGDVASADRYDEVADMLLFDAKPRPGDTLPGGNAHAFDWSLMSNVGTSRPWFLSGGLTEACLAEAIAVSGARFVDVSSGVESARGVKDHQKIEQFLATAADL
jgi:phosphoribosylanthranilate isomerase